MNLAAWRPRLTVTGLALWALVVTLVCASLLARHLLPLPAPSRTTLAPGLAALRGPEESGRPVVFHVLYAACKCSRRIALDLAGSEPTRGAREHALLVDDDAGELRALLDGHGLVLHDVRAPELAARFGVESAPLLIVASADGAVRYAGGYTDRKQALAVRGRQIINDALAGRATTELPVFGCAVSERMQRERNPLSLP